MSREVLLQVIRALNAQAIPYMLVDSFSTMFYGTERSTKDADLVLQLGDRSISPLFMALGPGFHCDPQMTLESATLTSRYVVQHISSEFKVEFFLLSPDEHDRERFQRRLLVDYMGAQVWVPRAEDVIITKMRWAFRVRRPKDEQDVAAVLGVQRNRLDLEYIRHWCDKHGSRSVFERIFAAVEAKLAGTGQP